MTDDHRLAHLPNLKKRLSGDGLYHYSESQWTCVVGLKKYTITKSLKLSCIHSLLHLHKSWKLIPSQGCNSFLGPAEQSFPKKKEFTLARAPARCLKITEKVSFNIASEASYVYILSGQKFIKNAKNGPFWGVFENLKLAVKQCYQTSQFQ